MLKNIIFQLYVLFIQLEIYRAGVPDGDDDTNPIMRKMMNTTPASFLQSESENVSEKMTSNLSQLSVAEDIFAATMSQDYNLTLNSGKMLQGNG